MSDNEELGANGIGGRAQKIAVSILIGLLVIAFAVWGVNDAFTPRAKNAVLSIGDVDVSTTEFSSTFRRELQTRGRDSGQQMTNEEAYGRGVHTEILQRMMIDAVIAVDADDLGIGVNRRTARDVVEEIETFQDDITGEFSERKLDELLVQNRTSRAEFEDDIYKSLRRQQTVPAIVEGIEAPADFVRQRYKFITESREATVLTLTEAAVPTPEAPSDDVLKSYIAANAALYTAPEYRRYTIMRVENSDVRPDIEVSEDQIRAAFEYQIELGQLGSPETRSVVQITTDNEAQARDVAQRLSAGEDAQVLTESLGLIEPVTYTDVLADDIFDPETAKLAFSLSQGQAEAVLGSLGNWYAVGVTGITAAVEPDFSAQYADIRESLLKDLADEQIYDISSEIDSAVTDGLTIEEISESLSLTYESVDFVDRQGLTQDGARMTGHSLAPDVAGDVLVMTEIFSNDLAYQTDLFQTSSGGWAIIRVDDIKDSAMRPFEDVKELAQAAWTREQIDAALGDLMVEFTSKVQEGQSLEDLAASLIAGATVENVTLTRTQQTPTVGPAVAQGLLTGAVGDIERGQGAAPLTRQIGKLTKIVSGEDQLPLGVLSGLQGQAVDMLSRDLQYAYQQSVLKEHTLREYPENIRQTLGITTTP